ncbi:MAG: two-component sensor histidine kinase, partial [Paenisporosarcina sp.]
MKNRIEFFRIIPFIYLLVGPIWVFGTDYYLLKTSNLSVEEIHLFETIKGLLFIVITAALLYVLLRSLSHSKKIEEEKEKLTLLIDTVPDLVSFKDGAGNCLQMNK